MQDGAYISGSSQFSPSVVIGNCVSIGHGAVIKGSTIGDYALVGINAVVSEGAKVLVMQWLDGVTAVCMNAVMLYSQSDVIAVGVNASQVLLG